MKTPSKPPTLRFHIKTTPKISSSYWWSKSQVSLSQKREMTHMQKCKQLCKILFIEPLLYISKHKQSFNLLILMTHVWREGSGTIIIPVLLLLILFDKFVHINSPMPQAGFNPLFVCLWCNICWMRCWCSNEPSHHGWILYNFYFIKKFLQTL